MRSVIKELNITVGLPASGKTTWAKSVASKGHNITHIEIDNYLGKRGCNTIESVISNRMNYYTEVIIDGLFLTESDVIEVIEAIQNTKREIKKVNIQYWEPNREVSLWNDLYRRELDSSITISNAAIYNFKDITKSKTKFPDIDFKVIRHEVVKVEAYRLFANKYNITVDEHGKYKGDSWCTGGTWRNCYDGGGNVSPDAQPEGMTELDNILEIICPSVTFLQYKKIMGRCVEIVDFSDSDYYGGRTHHNQYVLYVKSLYDYLVELELIKEIE